MARFLPFLISVALTVYALFSCIQTRNDEVPHLPKLVWIVLIVFVPFVGPIAWLLVSFSHHRQQQASVSRRRADRPPARPVAPDDDPDFLASLEPFRDPRLLGGSAKDDKPADPAAEVVPEADSGSASDAAADQAGPDDELTVDDAKSEPDDGPRA